MTKNTPFYSANLNSGSAKGISLNGTVSTPQTTRAVTAAPQVKNDAGGYSFKESDKFALTRFLIFGSATNTYYTKAEDNTKKGLALLVRLFNHNDWKWAVDRVVELSVSGLPRNDTAIFAMVVATKKSNITECRQYAFARLHEVLRTGTHIMMFMEFMDEAGAGWGAATRRAFKAMYITKPLGDVVYQAIKYRSRNGYSQRDLMRLVHPYSGDPARNVLFDYLANGWDSSKVDTAVHNGSVAYVDKNTKTYAEVALPEEFRQLVGFEYIKNEEDLDVIADAVTRYRLTWEMVPTHALKSASVWAALLPNLPLTALIRNMNRLTNAGLLKHGSPTSRMIIEKLGNQDLIRKSHINPINAYVAYKQYAAGQGDKGSLTWTPDMGALNALEDLFMKSYGNVSAFGKSIMIGLDCSGSMQRGGVSGLPSVEPIELGTALTLLYLNAEPLAHSGIWDVEYVPMTDSTAPVTKRRVHTRGSYSQTVEIASHAKSIKNMRIKDAIRSVGECSGHGGTDAGAIFRYATDNKLAVDVFLMITDGQSWAGPQHPFQAFSAYKNSVNPFARQVVIQVNSGTGCLSDPNDNSSMETVGFDLTSVDIINNFIAGNI